MWVKIRYGCGDPIPAGDWVGPGSALPANRASPPDKSANEIYLPTYPVRPNPLRRLGRTGYHTSQASACMELKGLYSFHALRRMIVMIGFVCGMVKHFGGPFVKQQGIRQFVGHQGTSDACAASRPAPHANRLTQQSRAMISDRE
jgi:hypothetical protein